MTSTEPTGTTRRQVLGAASLAALAALVTDVGPAAAASQPPKVTARMWTGRRSANGWPVLTAKQCVPTILEGSDCSVLLAQGPAALLLTHVARRWHYEVERVGPGEATGHSSEPMAADYLSAHLSGTAVSLHPRRHPVGLRGDLTAAQELLVRDILADCEGLVRWGGDSGKAPAEGTFVIGVGPDSADLSRVAARLSGPTWSLVEPAATAGHCPDPIEPRRMSSSRALARRQSLTGALS